MRTLSVLAVGASLTLAPLAALAQEADVQPQADAPAAAPSYDEAQLQAFADAVVAIEAVRSDYAPRLAEADEADQAALIEEANVAMVAAVEESGDITLEEYVAMSDAAAQDPALAERIVALLPEELKTQPEG